MPDLTDALVAIGGREQDEGRIDGFLWGVVTSTADPQNLYRVKVRLMSQDENADTHWIPPLLMGGMEGLPEQGETVAVLFCNGDPNRGAYLYSPTSKTKQRPTEAMVLGTTFTRQFNRLVQAYNDLRGIVFTAVTGFVTVYNAHIHTDPVSGVTSAPTVTWSPTDSGTAVKGKAADGSTPSDLNTSSIVLSKHGRVK